jgi:hypothetical protein
MQLISATANVSPILRVSLCSFALSTWILTACLPVALCQSASQFSPSDNPSYSAKATYTDLGKAAKSPDGKMKVYVRLPGGTSKYHPASVIVQTQHGKLIEKIQFGLDTEVLWSPDSQAFTMTGSVEGANGRYETSVFYVREDHLEQVELTRLIAQVFGHPVKCGWPEFPNIVAVKWLNPSQQILVAAQILHHSNCDSFGTFKAYAVDLTRLSIIETFDQLETKRRFAKDLGSELLQANDNCIRDPRSCYVPSNHPELKSSK